jgi:hypothetical protein
LWRVRYFRVCSFNPTKFWHAPQPFLKGAMPTWEQSFPKSKPFKCGHYWHLHKSGLLLAIYDFIGALTNGGRSVYYSSIRKVAIYFYGKESESSYETVRRAFRTLVKMGWLARDGQNYVYVPHEQWAKSHTGQCHVRGELLPWEESADPFIGKIWKLSEGKLRVYEKMIVAARRVATDEQFLAEFEQEIAAAKARRIPGGDWHGTNAQACFWRVYNFFKQQQSLSA